MIHAAVKVSELIIVLFGAHSRNISKTFFSLLLWLAVGVVACKQAPGKDGKKVLWAWSRRMSEVIRAGQGNL